ncbi:unnamed protein product [Darwinula stevensoni]|uniref:Peroxidase n=1 Tax=Darwinula stevensoni TaxID=69355 RepID=A0A7R9ABT5_9CRUS|nr:unnamed protein product [Darwinula stevensoni]CAG0899544.1 unnamed protein product [Darwinula stevensoni]
MLRDACDPMQEAEREYGKELQILLLSGARSRRPSFHVKSTKRSQKIGDEARILRIATSILEQKSEIPRKEAEYLVRREMFSWEREERARSGAPPASCSGVQPDCASQDPNYRTYGGVCNNLGEAGDPDAIYWGSAEIYYRRINNSNSYDDGVSIPRGSGDRLSMLPNPRALSSLLHEDEDLPAPTATHMIMQWGQFLDHDITLTPNGALPCCELDPLPVECFPIVIPSDDPFYSRLTVPQTCMNFQRSAPYCAGVFMKEHNRLADELKALNPAWDDERLFQEARKIVGAEMQNIHYGEFLLEAFGSSSYMEDYGLEVNYPSTYDPSLDPSHTNIFATSAYRQESAPLAPSRRPPKWGSYPKT